MPLSPLLAASGAPCKVRRRRPNARSQRHAAPILLRQHTPQATVVVVEIDMMHEDNGLPAPAISRLVYSRVRIRVDGPTGMRVPAAVSEPPVLSEPRGAAAGRADAAAASGVAQPVGPAAKPCAGAESGFRLRGPCGGARAGLRGGGGGVCEQQAGLQAEPAAAGCAYALQRRAAPLVQGAHRHVPVPVPV
eukprot:8533937-Pyramimonas_sp.AAC.1